MKDEDLLQCPLLRGLDAMHRSELIGLLNSSNLREKVEECLAERLHSVDVPEKPSSGEAPAKPRNWEKEVHGWNPELHMWRRSHKE